VKLMKNGWARSARNRSNATELFRPGRMQRSTTRDGGRFHPDAVLGVSRPRAARAARRRSSIHARGLKDASPNIRAARSDHA
jgi:hypothetical protein